MNFKMPETVFGIQLTEYQKDFYPALKWLLSGSEQHARTGRTVLLAIGFLEEAINQAGTWIEIFDHTPGQRGTATLLGAIERIIKHNTAMRKHFKVDITNN